MPDINQVDNPLYGYREYGMAGSLSTPTIAEVHFNPGELTEEERKHAKAVACVSFVRLLWYAEEMKKSNCSYREAVVTVNKLIKEN